MNKTLIIYASTTGNTKYVAQLLHAHLGLNADLINLDSVDQEVIDAHSLIVCCVSTWGNGLMQDDWDEAANRFGSLSFGGHTVAICGLGDQRLYPDHFADGAGILAEIVVKAGAKLIGKWSTEGYEFTASRASRGNSFCGLIIDDDNQHPLTHERIEQWTRQISREAGLNRP